MDNEHLFLGNYRGKVLSTDDPLQVGRVLLEVYPMLISKETAVQMKKDNSNSFIEGIDYTKLPWAAPAMPLGDCSGSNGIFIVPSVGSKVWVFFEGGDINQPVYFASAPDKVNGVPSERTTNYPKRRVIKTSGGIVIIMDDENGNINITSSGNITITGNQVSINP